MISASQIKSLRDKTSLSISACKKALEESGGDEAKAIEYLRSAGEKIAAKKSDRTLGSGAVAAYVHGGNIGVLVALACETDFVAKNPDFRVVADDIAMQISAMGPADTAELLAQPFIKDPSKTITDLVKDATHKFGERIEITKFSRVSFDD